MRAIAQKRFNEQFGDLLGARAWVTDSERLMIEYVYEQLFFESGDRQKAWEQRARAAFHFLDRGSLENHRGVAEHFLNCGELLGMSLNSAIDAKREAKELTGNSEAVVRRKLAYYKELVEGPYRVLLAPIGYAFAKAQKNTDLDFIPSPDGKAKLKILRKIERLTAYPQSQLAQGVNTHVRNAYAHSNYRILDWVQVELWDPAPQGKNKPSRQWGPETWHIDKIDALAEDLELTNLAFVLAISIYGINHRALIQGRNWSRTLTRPKLTEKELRFTIEHLASELGFDQRAFAIESNSVRIEFGTRYPGTNQTEEIFVGGQKWARKLLQKVEYIDVLVIDQLLGLFQKTNSYWDGYSKINISVVDPEGRMVGSIEVDASVVQKFTGPATLPIVQARKLLSVDTVGEAKMNYRNAHQAMDA